MSHRNLTKQAAFLDEVLPLSGASHADVTRYSVDIPMRYAECAATLADGRVVRLADSRHFIGRAGIGDDLVLLFRVDGSDILLSAGAGGYEINGRGGLAQRRKFIARDGSLVCARPDVRLAPKATSWLFTQLTRVFDRSAEPAAV